MATAKSPVTVEAEPPKHALVAWKDKVAALAKDVVATEKLGGNYISFQGGRLKIGEDLVPGDKMNIVVVNYVWEYAYFPNAYDPTKVVSPMCYAYGMGEETMEILGEDVQSDSCAGCPKNEWRSAGGGSRGKACKNSRKLALMHVDSLSGNIAKAEILYARLPVTSVKNFQKAATDVAKVLGVPPFGVVMEMSVVPNPLSQFQVNFKVVDQIKDDALLEALYVRHMALNEELRTPYPTNAELDERRTGGGKAGAGGKKY
jgi:hypothetical protein